MISKDQIQLVKSNRQTRQLANQKDFIRIALILLFLLVTVFPAYSLISLASRDISNSSSMLETDLLTGFAALSFGWFPASFSAIVALSSSNLISWAGCVGKVTQEGYINPDFRF